MNQKVARTAAVFGAGSLVLATAIIAKWEGEERIGYADHLAGGLPTACFGHTKTAVVGKRYSAEQCKEMLTSDVNEHAARIRACVPAGTPVEAQAAFLSLAFNIGTTAFCGSTVARRLNAGNLRGACDAMLMWAKARVAGKLVTIRGLLNRRENERALCLQGVR